jgi:hypothetical protein
MEPVLRQALAASGSRAVANPSIEPGQRLGKAKTVSTRANIIVTDGEDELIFYRHSDGYPDGTLPTLTEFIDLVKDGIIRDNVVQACGWLILIGALEDGVCVQRNGVAAPQLGRSVCWKVGAYEPTTAIHDDIEYLYVVDLKKKRIKHSKVRCDAGLNMVVPHSFYSGQFNPVKRQSEPGSPVNGEPVRGKDS